jgi:hypothetical protein
MKQNYFLFLLALMSLVFTGCSKDDSNEITSLVWECNLYLGAEFQIAATSNLPITYTSENEYHAVVSGTGLISTRFVGETNIILTNGKVTRKFKVTVRPRVTFYQEPDVKFGDSKSTVIAKLGAPDHEYSNTISYFDYSNFTPELRLYFDDNDQLWEYSLLVNNANQSRAFSFLFERYLYAFLSEDKETQVFINALIADEATMAVVFQPYDVHTRIIRYMIFPYLNPRPDQATSNEATVYRLHFDRSIMPLH